MPRILLRATWDDKLAPADRVSEDYLRKWKENEVRIVDIKKIRNPQHHRKAFAILKFALDNQETYPTIETLLDAVKIQTGHVDKLRFRDDGRIYYKPKSIAWGNLGQDEFNDFYVRMLDALEVITGIPAGTLEEGGRS